LKDESTKLSKVIVEIEGHNKDVLGQLKGANNQVDDLQTKLHGVEVKNAQLENENNELRAKLKAGDIYKQQLEQARKDYADAERRHADSLNSLGERVRHLDGALDRAGREKKALINENNKLNQNIADLNQQIAHEQANNRDLQHELEILNQRLKVAQSSVEILQSIQEQRQAILKDLGRVRGQNEDFQAQIANMTREIIERSRDIEAMERRYKDDLLRANQRIRDLEASLSEFRNDNAALKKDGIELRNHIITLEQLLCVKEDVYAQLQDTNTRLDARNGDVDSLRSQVDGSAKVIEGQEDKIYELEKCLIYLKNTCAEKEEVTNSSNF
jgi:chromosome segregation ATPase